MKYYVKMPDGNVHALTLREIKAGVKRGSIQPTSLTRKDDIRSDKDAEWFEVGQLLSSAATDQGETTSFGSVRLYVAGVTIGLFVCYAGVEENSPATLIVGLLIVLATQIHFCEILYRLWSLAIDESLIHDLKPSIQTPGKAVGYLFIPIFNLYWMFRSFGALPDDLNRIAKAKGRIDSKPDTMGKVLPFVYLYMVFSTFAGSSEEAFQSEDVSQLNAALAYVIIAVVQAFFIKQSIRTCHEIEKTAYSAL